MEPATAWATDTPARKAEIPEAFDNIDREIIELDAVARELASRLEPVLGQSTPHAIPADQTDRPWSSGYGSRAAAQAGQIQAVASLLRELLSRLEV